MKRTYQNIQTVSISQRLKQQSNYLLKLECFLLIISLVFQQTSTQIISCPTISCDTTIDNDACYKHDEAQSAIEIRSYSCDTYTGGTTKVCDFQLDKSAWFDEKTLHLSTSTNPSISQLYKKRTLGYCKEVQYVTNRMQNNGRTCSDSSQCFSKRCVSGICTGLDVNSQCTSHGDCQPGYYCNQSPSWPFSSICTRLKVSGNNCTADEECIVSNYCWYATVKDREATPPIKKCMPVYSQEDGTSFGWFSNGITKTSSFRSISLEDYKRNGQYCKSGFAFPLLPTSITQANCTSVEKIMYQLGSQKLQLFQENSFNCSVTNQTNKCELNFLAEYPNPSKNASQRKYQDFLVECGCAMDGNNGYCSQVLGTDIYRNAVQALRQVLQESACHTLDRNDFKAQRDTCGISDKSVLDSAIDQLFNVNHWPLVQGDQTTNCIKSLFPDSLQNQQKMFALLGVGASLALTSMISFGNLLLF
eukprot:403374054